MVKSIQQLWQLSRYFGPRWVGYRALYAIQQRVGWLRRQTPATPWEKQPLEGFLEDSLLASPVTYLSYRRSQGAPFFFVPNQRAAYQTLLSFYDKEGKRNPIQEADQLAAGQMIFFAHNLWETGVPPHWHRNIVTGEIVPADRHWSQIPDFGLGDIKVIWEPSRFGFVYALVRAYWRTGDERYAALFWQLVEDWRKHNPPNLGPNWKCGQETTFRVMAWIFGFYGFLDAPSTTAARITSLAQMIAVSAHRIESNLQYALSQRNNHGISEGVGLWTVGLLFPEFQRSEVWREKGRNVLERLARELIYKDGAFVQHSVNYHRVMLHDYLWAIRLGDLNGQPLSNTLRERVMKATKFLYQIQDRETGQVPYYGQNDGSLILPLNNCDYQDFRPVVQASCYLLMGKRCYPSGPWDEDMLWLFGPQALHTEVAEYNREDFWANIGGYYTIRSNKSFAFVRCATFRDRPGQADMLHLDLWWQGENIAIDPGTYSYNAPEPWNNPLAHTAYHNTVTVDNMDQMDRRGKFLWLPWLQSQIRVMKRSHTGFLTYWEGEHDGYQRLSDPIIHRRGILRVGEDVWLILDYLEGQQKHNFRLHWLFPDWPYEWRKEAGELILQTPRGPYYVQTHTPFAVPSWSFVRADEGSPRGWRSPYYYYREPALSLALEVQASIGLFATLFSPLPIDVEFSAEAIDLITGEWQLAARLFPKEGHLALLDAIELMGKYHDFLEVE